MSADDQSTDVIICGCGPTGAMLSAYLGRHGIKNVVLEKGLGITTDPRGIALDEDGIRLLQGLGIYEHIYTDIGTCMHQFRFVGGRGNDLMRKPFMLMDYTTTEGGTGHVGFICHKQPVLEKHLRSAMAQTPYSTLHSGTTVTGISEDDNGVTCHYKDRHGEERHIRCKFFVGADGKTGFTRKKYLEPRGVSLERADDMAYEETWVALNWRISPPTPSTHKKFPLWELGFSPRDVYDAFFPKNFRFLCNPDRAAVCGRFGLEEDGLWRFEFVVKQGEDPDEMASWDMVKKIVFPYLRHAGSRYGLVDDVEFPEDCIEVLRCRPFTFSARSCNRWALGRVVLCGDAAHVFPPFGGQGIASGFRDAQSLAWRLAAACDRATDDKNISESLLKSWYGERKQQLERSLATTVENGEFVTQSDPVKILMRDWYLWFLQLFPPWRHQLHLGNRRDGMVRYTYEPGMPFVPELGGGACLPQVYCRRIGEGDGEVFFTDDVIWGDYRRKRRLFSFLVLLQSSSEVSDATDMVEYVSTQLGDRVFKQDVAILIEDLEATVDGRIGVEDGYELYQVASAEDFAASRLCNGRPAPMGYDPFRLGKEVGHKKYLFLRPDRFVFAACDTKSDIDLAVKRIKGFPGEFC